MDEYIGREALRDAVESIDWYSVYKGKLTTGSPNTENALYKASSVYEVIDNMPAAAADVAPVVYGRWDKNGRCTVCGVHAPFWCMASTYYKSPYCFECGARMDLGGDDNDL